MHGTDIDCIICINYINSELIFIIPTHTTRTPIIVHKLPTRFFHKLEDIYVLLLIYQANKAACLCVYNKILQLINRNISYRHLNPSHNGFRVIKKLSITNQI